MQPPTTPPRPDTGAVETPATPVTPAPKRAKTHEERVAEAKRELDEFWKNQPMEREDARFLLELEVGELKEALSSFEAEVAKLKAELEAERTMVGSLHVMGIPSRYLRPVVDTFLRLHRVHSSSILLRDITV